MRFMGEEPQGGDMSVNVKVNVNGTKKFQGAASFLEKRSLILDGGEGLLEVVGAGGAAGGGVRHDPGADGFICDPP